MAEAMMEHLQLINVFRKKGMEKFSFMCGGTKWILDDAAKTLDHVQR